VRSGDYVATLATRLDQLTESQPNTPEKAQLETVVSELLYIDNRYKLAKK
jgi:hypothetical protein